jgi:hypothetical protein
VKQIGSIVVGVIVGSLVVGLAMALAAPLLIWRAFVSWKLWSWFEIPMGAPTIGLVQILGLVILLRSLLWYPKKTEPEKKDEKDWTTRIGTIATDPIGLAFLLLVGWIVKAWL